MMKQQRRFTSILSTKKKLQEFASSSRSTLFVLLLFPTLVKKGKRVTELIFDFCKNLSHFTKTLSSESCRLMPCPINVDEGIVPTQTLQALAYEFKTLLNYRHFINCYYTTDRYSSINY